MAKAKKKIAKKLNTKKKSKAAKSRKVAKPTKSAKSAKSAKPAKTAKSAKPARAAKPAKTAKSAKPARTAKPAKPPATTTMIIDVSQFVTPLDDRIVVQLNPRERITSGGLIIPDTVSSTEGYREGTVLAVGRGHRDPKGRLRPMDVKSGDKVLFSEYAGSKIQYQNAELMILRETDVMGVVS